MAIDREKVLAAAQKYVEKKKYDKAIVEYQKIIQEEPNDARTLLKIGDLQSKMADFPAAIATYERVGKSYAHQGFALKAIAVYKQIRELLVKHAPQLEDRYAHITPLLADLFQQLGLTSDALAALDEIASRFQRQQRDGDALDVLRRIVELDPTNPLPHLRLAEALSRMKDAEGAVQEFGDAASLLVKLGRRDDAIKVFERLLHLKPDVAFAHQCAELYLDRGMGQDGMLALAKLQLCFQADPKNLDTLALLARAFGAIGQANKGIEVQKEMARLAKEQGQDDLFRQLIEKLMRVAPNDEQVRALAMTSGQMAAVDAQTQAQGATMVTAPDRAPVIRDGGGNTAVMRGSRPDEPSYAPVDSQDFVDESEIEEVEDSIAGKRQSVSRQPAAAPISLRSSANDFSDSTEYTQRPAFPSTPDIEASEASEEESLEIIGEDGGASEAEIQEAVAQALADAASFRRVRLYAKALEALQTGLELDPMSRRVHESIRDILIETGAYKTAAEHVVVIAGMQIEEGDVDGAAQGLYDALALEPGLKQAEEMLDSLGYELPQYESTERASVHEFPTGSAGPTEPPLPAYPLDDAGHATMPPPALDDEPEEERTAGGEPLPSFPMAGESEPAFDLVHPKTGPPPSSVEDVSADAEPVEAGRTAELEEVLEEADFFASRGLFDDARMILTEQLELHPRHILLQERLAELDAQEQATRGGSGPREVPRAAPALDRSFDIAASLDALETLDTTGSMAASSFDTADKQIDVEEVFAKFKEGVAKQVSVDDAQSHYDLGVAYKEMGLLEDAIREFEVAARDEKRACVCQSMVGMIQVERGKVPEAIDAFQRGLASPSKTGEQEMVLCYEIGAAYESMHRTKEAVSFFQRVARRDASYRDVEGRIRRLTSRADPKPAALAAAVGADDEFDRAFEEILGDDRAAK